MKRLICYTSIAVALGGFSVSPAEAQLDDSRITTERMKIVILPAETGSSQNADVTGEIAGIVTNIITNMGRFDVIDRASLDKVLEEIALGQTGIIDEEQAIEAGKVLASNTGLLLKVTYFNQKGVPTEKDKKKEKKEEERKKERGILEKIVDAVIEEKKQKREERYPHNIRTDLAVLVKKLNIEEGRVSDSFEIRVEHTGGYKNESRAKVMKEVRTRVEDRLRTFYVLKSQIVERINGLVFVLIGSEVGAKTGMKFDVYEERGKREVGDRKFVLPDKKRGIIKLTSISPTTSEALILRGRGTIEKNHFLKERLVNDFGIGLNARYLPDASTAFFGLSVEYDQYNSFTPGLSAHFTSPEGIDLLLGGGIYGGFKLIRTEPFDFSGEFGVNIFVATAKDSAASDISSIAFQVELGPTLDIYMSDEFLLTAHVGYALGSKIDSWKIIDENGDSGGGSPLFSGEAPTFNPNGLTFRLGVKFILPVPF